MVASTPPPTKNLVLDSDIFLTLPTYDLMTSYDYIRLSDDTKWLWYSRVEGVKVLVSEPEDEVGPVSALLRGVGVAGKVHWETADTNNNLSLSCNHVRLKIHKLL